MIDRTKLQNIASGKLDNYINGTFLSLGSNIRDRVEHLRKAVECLTKVGCSIVALSPVFQSTPWKMPNSADFFNMVLLINHGFEPHELLAVLQGIEQSMGRVRESNGYVDRPIDLDILYINGTILSTETLQIPHPRMAHRLFVLSPLHCLLPEGVHPITNLTTAEMLALCTDTGVCEEVGDLSYLTDQLAT